MEANNPRMNAYDGVHASEARNEDYYSLLDYFAGQVLQGIHSNSEMWINMCLDKKNLTRDNKKDSHEDYVAQVCYNTAKAMLKERDYVLKLNNL